MSLDIRTIALSQSLLFLAQLIILFIQYNLNWKYRRIKWWVYGTFLMPLVASLMPLAALIWLPIRSYDDQAVILQIELIIPSSISMICTFGLIIIFNQHLNSGNVVSKENYRSISKAYPNVITINELDGRISMQAEQKIQVLIQELENERNKNWQNTITDSLTGIANRRFFDEALKKEFYRLKRSGAVLSLIMIEVDYYENFTDYYGRLAGEKCLSRIGHMLLNSFKRAADIVTRYGGEEFVAILPETDENGAKKLAEKVRKSVEELAIPNTTSEISNFVTVSVGVVSVYTIVLEKPEKVINLVDEALYKAKNSGRNRIEIATNIY